MILVMVSIIIGFLDGLKPDIKMTVTRWADNFRVLDSVAAAEPGPYRSTRTPYLIEIMDRLSSTDMCEEVIVEKGAQVGATEAGSNWIGHNIDLEPGPFLLVMPTDEMAKRTSKKRIDPMIDATPRLRSKVKPARSRDSGNTILQKDFPGGVLIITGANSPVGLRSMPARYLMLDEVDAYPLDVGGEGSPIDLAKARQRTFKNRKRLIISTPTVEGRSTIDAEFKKSGMRYFHIPCPVCGTLIVLFFEQLRWEKGKPETAAYICQHCSGSFGDHEKVRAMAHGIWIPEHPERENGIKYGYHISGMYSPWHTFADIARDYEEAEKDIPKLITFVNTVKGETYKEESEVPDWNLIYNKREYYKQNVPNENVCFITCGCDVQKDRLELELVGWGKGKESWSIDYRVLLGNTSDTQVWDELAKVLDETWEREDGVILTVKLLAVDSGYNTSHVYDFCRRFDVTRVIPVKGQEAQTVIVSPPRSIDVTRDGKKIDYVRVWNIGVSVIKSELYGWLKLQKKEGEDFPFGYCHFPQYSETYFRGLTAEVLERRINRGFAKYVWVKKYERNEQLDCRVYARAAASVCGMDLLNNEGWDNLRKNAGIPAPNKNKSDKKKNSFWN